MSDSGASGGPGFPPTHGPSGPSPGERAPAAAARRRVALVVAVVTIVALTCVGLGWWLWPPAARSRARTVSSASRPGIGASPSPSGSGSAVVLFRDILFFSSEVSKNTLYVVGELVNVSSEAVAVPAAKITMFDAGKAPLDITSCAAPGVYDLQPGRKVPCQAVLTKAEGWKSYRVQIEVGRDTLGRRGADLEISEPKTTEPRRRYGADVVSGTVTNRSSFTAKQVWLFVGLYDAGGKIVAAGRAPVASGELEAGATSTFSASIFAVAGKPTKSLTKVFGYDR